MRSTIDRAGRVVIPKAIRDRLRLLAGGDVDIVERDGVIEIVPAAVVATITETTEGPVAVAPGDQPALTDDVVLAAIDASRR